MDRHTFVPNTEIWYLPYLSRHFSYTHSYFSNTIHHKTPKHYHHISKNLYSSNTQTFYSKLLFFKHKIRNKSGAKPLFVLYCLLLTLPSLFTFLTLLDELQERNHHRKHTRTPRVSYTSIHAMNVTPLFIDFICIN